MNYSDQSYLCSIVVHRITAVLLKPELKTTAVTKVFAQQGAWLSYDLKGWDTQFVVNAIQVI